MGAEARVTWVGGVIGRAGVVSLCGKFQMGVLPRRWAHHKQHKSVASVRVVSTRRHHTSPSRMVGSTVCRLILRPLSVVERDSADGGVAMAAPAARAELENGRKKCPDNWSGGLS
jgi:hypothetical protein